MTTAVMEREVLHKMIDKLPFFQDEDDEPLTESELEQLAASRDDIAAGRVYSLDEVWKEHLSLP